MQQQQCLPFADMDSHGQNSVLESCETLRKDITHNQVLLYDAPLGLAGPPLPRGVMKPPDFAAAPLPLPASALPLPR